jgi:type IV secretion system protein VirD4
VPAVLALAAFAVGWIAATQCFAYLFRHDDALGINVGGLYPPWAFIQWLRLWGATAPEAVRAATSVGIFVTAALLGVVAAVKSLMDGQVNHYTHGSARWAAKKDIQAAGLLPRNRASVASGGVYLGAFRDRRGRLLYLRHAGPEHILTYGPTRSGKSLSLMMTLLSHTESVLVSDLKGELVNVTSGWRSRYAKNRVLIFEPAHRDSVCWNPLDEIDIAADTAIADAQNLAMIVVDPDGRGLENHWDKTAQALLTGMILYVLHRARNGGPVASLPGIDAELSNPNRNIHELWAEMTRMEVVHPAIAEAGKLMLDEEVRAAAGRNAGWAGRDMLDRPDEEGGSVLSSTKSVLSLYRDPIVARNVSSSDFQISDLMNYTDPVTLYLVTQPLDKARLRPLVRLFMTSVVRKLAPRIEFVTTPPKRLRWWHMHKQPGSSRAKAKYKHPLLMELDEFPTMGKMNAIQEALGFMAGYGIKAHIHVQDITQLKTRDGGYGPDEVITSGCHVQSAYPPNRIETAEYLSRMTGVTTVLHESVTRSGSGLTARSRTTQEIQRPLLTPDECMRLPGAKKDGGAEGNIVEAGDMVIYVAGYPAIYATQALSVLDPVFRARMAVPPVRSDVLRPQVRL